jgi:hypothetical protein
MCRALVSTPSARGGSGRGGEDGISMLFGEVDAQSRSVSGVA